MKGIIGLKKYIRYKFPSDKMVYDRKFKQVTIKSFQFICDPLCDLTNYCKTHGFWYWIEPVDDNSIKIVIMRA